MRRRPLRLAFDMDGVLADLDSALAREALVVFGEVSVTPKAPLTKRRRRKLWQRVQDTRNFWETLEEMEPGGVSRLAALVRERQWEVVFLTTRPETAGDSAQTQTHRWLVDRGFPCPNVFVVRRSRGAIAAVFELDVVVDDRPENCLDVVSDSAARAVLAWRRTTEAPSIVLDRLRIDVVSGVNGALDLLAEIDAGRREPRPLLSRLFQTFAAARSASVI
jgi:hypothetical protein